MKFYAFSFLYFSKTAFLFPPPKGGSTKEYSKEYHIPFLTLTRQTVPYSSSVHLFPYTTSEPGIGLRNRTAPLPNHSRKVSRLARLLWSIIALPSSTLYQKLYLFLPPWSIGSKYLYSLEKGDNQQSRITEVGSTLTCAVFTSPIEPVTIFISYRISALYPHLPQTCNTKMSFEPPVSSSSSVSDPRTQKHLAPLARGTDKLVSILDKLEKKQELRFSRLDKVS